MLSLILERRIAYTKLGRHVRIAPRDLDTFIRAGRVEVDDPRPGVLQEGPADGPHHPPAAERQGEVPGAIHRSFGSGAAKSFTRKKDAERFLTGVENDKLRGTWTDPTLPRIERREMRFLTP